MFVQIVRDLILKIMSFGAIITRRRRPNFGMEHTAAAQIIKDANFASDGLEFGAGKEQFH